MKDLEPGFSVAENCGMWRRDAKGFKVSHEITHEHDGVITISAKVSEKNNYVYHSSVSFSEDMQTLIDCGCDCPIGRLNAVCPHCAAVAVTVCKTPADDSEKSKAQKPARADECLTKLSLPSAAVTRDNKRINKLLAKYKTEHETIKKENGENITAAKVLDKNNFVRRAKVSFSEDFGTITGAYCDCGNNEGTLCEHTLVLAAKTALKNPVQAGKTVSVRPKVTVTVKKSEPKDK